MDEYWFGEWLLDEMEKRGLTKRQLAKMTGMSTVGIGYYIDFKRHPRADSMRIILDALGKHIEIVDN